MSVPTSAAQTSVAVAENTGEDFTEVKFNFLKYLIYLLFIYYLNITCNTVYSLQVYYYYILII